ncbi:MAG: hypothetical protein D6748_11970 [Calditrichaeota bacterium]|nr:MAG: hypothetical protein D6748_11970 [Calditrichota bacterium]
MNTNKVNQIFSEIQQIFSPLKNWERKADLSGISVLTLVIGAKYDTMDPEHMEWVASEVQHGRYLYYPNGSHMSMYDDQQTWFEGDNPVHSGCPQRKVLERVNGRISYLLASMYPLTLL